jgi:hypothetical protein
MTVTQAWGRLLRERRQKCAHCKHMMAPRIYPRHAKNGFARRLAAAEAQKSPQSRGGRALSPEATIADAIPGAATPSKEVA